MRGNRWAAAILVVAGLSPSLAAADTPPGELTVYAAASLRDVLQSLAPKCEKVTGTRLVFNFGASNDLARQIEAGNKADVFLSADEAWMDKVAQAGLVDAGSRRALLSNRLVVIARQDSSVRIAAPSDLAASAIKRISLADPQAVPAGKYARAWLDKTGVWETIADRILPALDVRAALAAVESGGADVGVVYRTDAAISDKVRVLYEVPESDGPRISYAVAALSQRPRLDAARRVVDWLAGPAAAAAFEKSGFIVLPPPA